MTSSTTWLTRTERPDDRAAVHAVNMAAFPTEEEADLVDALRQDSAWIDGLSAVATTADGLVAGYALLTRCHIGEVPALCLAPCAVLPEFQRKGAGTAAINSVLDAAKAQGEALVVVLGHPSYYPRFGFERASTHGIHLSIEVDDEASMALSLDPTRQLPGGLVRCAPPFGI